MKLERNKLESEIREVDIGGWSNKLPNSLVIKIIKCIWCPNCIYISYNSHVESLLRHIGEVLLVTQTKI